MNEVIIYTNAKGGVSVCIPTGEMSIEEVLAKDIPQGVQCFVVEKSALPNEDDDFFDAWEQTNGVVSVNIEKAREITKNRLRAQRAPLLAEQDIAFQRAIENNADTKKIVAEKTRLRDITKKADAMNSTQELRALVC